MKLRLRLLRMAMAVILAACATNAHATSLNFSNNAFLVPYATFTSGTATTVIGLVTRNSGTLYWKFFDQDGGQLQNGGMNVVANQMVSFIWSSEANPALAGTKGYLLFAIDTNGDGLVDANDALALTANAFFVDLSASDVVFIPTVMVLNSGLSSSDPASFVVQTLPGTVNGYGMGAGKGMDLRYYIDGAPGGEDSSIILWTAGDPGATQAVTMYDGDGNFKGVTLNTPHSHLNVLDPEAIADRPATYLDGFIRWNPIPAGAVAAYGFTLVNTTAFGAAQTLLAAGVY